MIPWKKTEMCVFECMYDVSLSTVYWEHLTENSYFTNSPWLIAVMFQSNRGYWLTACESKVRGSVSLVNAGWRKVRGRALVSLCGAGFASWQVSPRLSSCPEWSAACPTPAPQGRKLVPSPNLSWHWSHRTWRASCLLQSDKQDDHVTSIPSVLIKDSIISSTNHFKMKQDK